MSYGLCGASRENRSPSRRSCSHRNVEHPSALQGSLAWSSGPALRPSSASRPTHTCFGTPAATLWQAKGTTQGHCRLTWAMATSSTRYATRSCRRRGSRISGGLKRLIHQLPTWKTNVLPPVNNRCSGRDSCAAIYLSRPCLLTRSALSLICRPLQEPRSSLTLFVFLPQGSSLCLRCHWKQVGFCH